MNRIVSLAVLFIIVLSACKNQTTQPEEEFIAEPSVKESAEVKEVIYSMYLPTDMSDLFEKAGSNFNPEIPAPVNTLPLYTNPEQIALMLGVFGVDLSYMKILQQKALAAEYYSAIKVLAVNLEIPDEIFEESSKNLEKNLENQDSLAAVIERIYSDTDKFFRESNKDNLASISLLGGWIEAMHIGVSIFESEEGNKAMAHKLLQQKYTLNSIYSILSNHQESLRVTSYLLMLKRLRKEFEKVEIRYPVEGFSVDTTQKRIQTANAMINYEPATLTEINSLVTQMREELVKVEDGGQ